MISQSSVAVATGCWNWDRRAARTTERSSISRAGGAQPLYVRPGAGSRAPWSPQLHATRGALPPPAPSAPSAAALSIAGIAMPPWSRCGLGVSPLSLGVVAPSLAGREGPALGGAATERGTSWVPPRERTHAAGVQGSLSSCNIPHMKYEAKFLLILHEERGVNCVLPNSSSRVLQSLCLQSPSSFRQRLFPIFRLSSLP